MKKSWAMVLAVLLGSATVYGTNGANLIGLTPQSVGAGGTGIAAYIGVESLVKNPALLSGVKSSEFLFGANFVAIDPQARIQYSGGVLNADTGYQKSAARNFVIPEVGFISRIDSNWTYGVGLFGTAGFGVDYRNDVSGGGVLSNIRSHLMVLQVVPGVAYASGPLSLGVSTKFTYGVMSLSAAMPDQTGSPNTVQQRGGGLSDSLSSAFQFGAGYDIDPTIKIGATYTTSTPLRFQKLFDFDRNGSYDDFAVDLPAELGIGVSKKWNAWQFSVDVKQIYWSAANGFKHLLWKDQTVVGLGVAYEWIPNKLVVRGGYNYSPSVVSDRSDLSAQNGFNSISSGQFFDSNVSFFNLAGFGPAAAGQHSFTLGAGYKITPNLNFDFGAQYLLQNTVTQTGKTSLAGPNDTNALYSARNSGVIVSTALTWSL